MNKTKIWMPLYIADYLADTNRLSTEQHGAYLLLIMDYWRNGPLPDDDAALAQIARLSLAAWKKQRSALARFFTVANGQWQHQRIETERKTAADNARKCNERASKAAHTRWHGATAPKPATETNQPGANAAASLASAAPMTTQSSEAFATTIRSAQQHKVVNQASSMIQAAATNATSIALAKPAACPSPAPAPQTAEMIAASSAEISESPASTLAAALRELGVRITSAHPLLQSWLQSGIALDEAREAVALARQHKPAPEPIPAAYLDRVLQSQRQAIANASSKAPAARKASRSSQKANARASVAAAIFPTTSTQEAAHASNTIDGEFRHV